jgi:hypothetical protein
MTRRETLTKIFNQFVGREIPMVESEITLPRWRPEHPVRTMTEVTPANAPDPTLEAMEKTAEDNGLMLNAYWEGGPGLPTFCFGRPKNHVIADVKKDADGKYRVKSFDIKLR